MQSGAISAFSAGALAPALTSALVTALTCALVTALTCALVTALTGAFSAALNKSAALLVPALLIMTLIVTLGTITFNPRKTGGADTKFYLTRKQTSKMLKLLDFLNFNLTNPLVPNGIGLRDHFMRNLLIGF